MDPKHVALRTARVLPRARVISLIELFCCFLAGLC